MGEAEVEAHNRDILNYSSNICIVCKRFNISCTRGAISEVPLQECMG